MADGADSCEGKSSQPQDTLAQFVDLLGAHLDLISKTSEDTALRLSEGLSEIRVTLSEMAQGRMDETRLNAALERASELQADLQSQDILRQQVVAVRHGVATLASLPVADVSMHMEGMKSDYVMPQQWDIHARITGEPEGEPPTQGTAFFF